MIMAAPKVVVLGSCNVDFTTYAPRLPMAGETLVGTKFVTSFGGKGANQAIAASRLGAQVSIIAKVGDDEWGVKYREYLQGCGVDTTHLTVAPGLTTGVAQICVSSDGENHIVVVGGANAALSADDVAAAADVLRAADVVAAQLESPLAAVEAAFKLTQGKRVLNAAPARAEARALLPLSDIVCVNRLEAAQLTGLHPQTLSEMSGTMRELLEAGCGSAVVTLGAEGAAVASRGDTDVTRVHTQTVTCVDSTGAGDAFVGALATFLSGRDATLRQAVGAACGVAALSVTRPGTHDSYPTHFHPFTTTYPHETISTLPL